MSSRVLATILITAAGILGASASTVRSTQMPECQTEAADSTEMQRRRYVEQMRLLNAVGTVAPDFDIVLADGTATRLAEVVPHQVQTVLVLYNPDCDSCHAYLRWLRANQAPLQAIVVIDVAGDRELMLRDAQFNPPTWIFATATTDIEEEPLYFIESFPTVFIIDSKRTVLQRVDVAEIIDEVARDNGIQ